MKKMRKFTEAQLKEILEKHRKWVLGEDGGERADLTDAWLNGAQLTGALLNGARLTGARLTGAQLTGADLTDAQLTGARLNGALLTGAQLTGAYVGYKKARGLIVELEITADALRSSATSRKCRASKAKVLSITDVDGNPAGEQVESDYDKGFVYIVGETVEVPNFDANRWNECGPGIHHFITREEAVKYS